MDLHQYDIIIINSSGGKDSLAAIFETCRMAQEQDYPFSRIHVSHQDLGSMEWEGTTALARQQAELFGLGFHVSKMRDKNKKEISMLEYVVRRFHQRPDVPSWPSNNSRWCTSDYKRGPGGRIVTQLTKDLGKCKVLHVFGFRASESPSRKKKEVLAINKKLTTNTRLVHDWLPIHSWDTAKVWQVIKENKLPYHRAYTIGMPRLSCVFCIFSPFDALVIAGRENPALLDEYIAVEDLTGYDFRNDFSLKQVREKIQAGEIPTAVADWVM